MNQKRAQRNQPVQRWDCCSRDWTFSSLLFPLVNSARPWNTLKKIQHINENLSCIKWITESIWSNISVLPRMVLSETLPLCSSISRYTSLAAGFIHCLTLFPLLLLLLLLPHNFDAVRDGLCRPSAQFDGKHWNIPGLPNTKARHMKRRRIILFERRAERRPWRWGGGGGERLRRGEGRRVRQRERWSSPGGVCPLTGASGLNQ